MASVRRSAFTAKAWEGEDFLKTSGWKSRPLHEENDPPSTSLASFPCLMLPPRMASGMGTKQGLLLSNDDKEDI